MGREARLLPSWEKTAAAFALEFAVGSRRAVRWTVALDTAGIADVLASSYRGARHAERQRLAGIERLAATMSREILTLEPA